MAITKDDLVYDLTKNNWVPAIDLPMAEWQQVVLDVLIDIHHRSMIGHFYKKPVVVIDIRGLDKVAGKNYRNDKNRIYYRDWNTMQSNSPDVLRTDHVIPIADVDLMVSKRLAEKGIEYERNDEDARIDPDGGVIGLQQAILLYLLLLVNDGYLVDLNTCIGHEDEYSFKLTKKMLKVIE